MIPRSYDLSGKVAIVTGSTRGIGRSIAEQLAHHGARVVISSRKADACDAVAAEINAKWLRGPAEAIAVPCHIGHKDQCRNLVDRTIERWGRIDILVCNAAVNPYMGSLMEMPDEAFDKVMSINVRSNIWLASMVGPHMKAQRDGTIIIISSTGGLRGSAVLGAYGLSKAADMQLVRNLTVEYGPHNIRSNCIAPALVRTDFARALWEDPQRYETAVRSYPLGRIGEPEDISGIAVMLASKAGSWITGQTLVVDGGAMAAIGRYA